MKLTTILFALIFVIVLLPSCGEEEDPRSVVGAWEVITHDLERVRAGEVIFEATYYETGTYRFNNDGTGFVMLKVPVIGVPVDQEILWREDSVGRIIINYNDGTPVHRFDPSYRGDFLLLTGTQVSGNLGNLLFTNSEIFFRRQ